MTKYNLSDEILTVKQLSVILEASERTIEQYIRKGEIAGFKRLRKWFVMRSDLINFITGGEEEPAQS